MSADGDGETTNKRRSGRVVRKPDVFGDDQNDASVVSATSTKRKRDRTTNGRAVDEDDQSDDLAESSSDENESESEPDEEELKEQRIRKKTKSTIARPLAKRSKTTNGSSTTLAIRPAGRSKAPVKAAKMQKARSRPSQLHATGLYAEVFGHSNTGPEAAAGWHKNLEDDNTVGVRDLVNFVLECIGCDTHIDTSDIEDVDHVPEKLGEVIDEYAAQKSGEYPLTSRSKQYAGMREVLMAFFNAVVHALHDSGLLYSEPAVYDNIHVWIATMSGAGYRPFRHTATVASLSMTTALCEIAKELEKSMATSKDQIDAEKRKKTTNKARVKKLQEETAQEEGKLDHINGLLKDAFDTVYIHRYRDVDEKIRVECAAALGTWISRYRAMFLEGQYLRYLGWVLSDPNASTRLEVVRALTALFKDRKNTGALRAFTERFRERMVEMSSRDTDISVRAEAIELVDLLRSAELLKVDDIDTIGQLIFDNEVRVRKAVAKFFVSNIQDLYDSNIEGFDQEQYSAALPQLDDVDDFMNPCQSWIKYKSLVQTLVSQEKDSESRRRENLKHEIYAADDSDSRYMLATQSIYTHMPELHQWQSLAGCLLFDHSGITAEPDDADLSLAVQGAYKLENGEDTVLLDVLYCSVRLYLQQITDSQNEKKGKKAASKDELRNQQEAAARHLALIIPKLLNKFGGNPEAAASILRLEQLLNVDLISELQTGEGIYDDILEDINKQFTTHNDRKVLTEASKALRTARTYETSQDAVDAKVAELWNDSKETLSTLLQGQNIPSRGTLDKNRLQEIEGIMIRLAQLASVSDCTESVESRMPVNGKQKAKSKAVAQTMLLDVLFQLLNRGVADEDTTEQFVVLEDRVCESIMMILSIYFRWKIVGLKKAIADRNSRLLTTGLLTNLVMQRTSFVGATQAVIMSRPPIDLVRVTAVLTLLDLYVLFATVRHMKPTKGNLKDETQSNLNTLATTLSPEILALILDTHEKMEKRLAKRMNKRIEVTADSKRRKSGTASSEVNDDDDVEKPPEDSEDENEDDSDADEDDSEADGEQTGKEGREAKKQASLIAEKALCELTSKLVLAIIANITGADQKVKARLQLNRTRLGRNYSQVIAYLDEKKSKKSKSAKAATPSTAKAQTPVPKSAQKPLSEPLIIEEDDIEDEDMEDGDGVEEGDEQDLRVRGLEDDPVEEGDDGDDQNGRAADEEAEDEVMGD